MPNKKVVFAGHGALNAKSDKEFFTVPAGVTLYFWVRHGSAFVGSELDGHDPRELLGYMFQPEVRAALPGRQRKFCVMDRSPVTVILLKDSVILSILVTESSA
jgi:hypothetical protein